MEKYLQIYKYLHNLPPIYDYFACIMHVFYDDKQWLTNFNINL